MIATLELVLGMLVVVAALGLLSRKVGLPLPILLVVSGVLLGLVPGLPSVKLNPEMVFLVILPPLLYPAAVFTPWRDFHNNIRPIFLLAVGLVLFTTTLIGYLAHHYIPGLPLAAAFVLGAIISPPDAVAATAITQRLRVPRRIVTVLDGESLVNDATALVAYRFAVAATVTGTFSLGQATVKFFVVSLGGILTGLVVGWLSTTIQKRIEDPPIEITLSILTPFAAYIPAEQFGVSGVLAVVTTGLYYGWRIPEITSPKTRLQAGPVWEMIEFLLNGFVFLLIGLQIPEVWGRVSHRSPGQLVLYALGISVAVILLRILWVFPATYLPRWMFKSIRKRDPVPPWQSVALVGWTGMRGVVSLAAALGLPEFIGNGSPFPGRDLILFLTFSVIIATLVLQGLTLPWVIRKLGVHDDGSAAKEEHHARLQANRAALEHLNSIMEEGGRDSSAAQRLRIEYEDRIRQLELTGPHHEHGIGSLYSTEYDRLAREILQVERSTLIVLRNERVINDEILRLVQRDIDLAEAHLGQH